MPRTPRKPLSMPSDNEGSTNSRVTCPHCGVIDYLGVPDWSPFIRVDAELRCPGCGQSYHVEIDACLNYTVTKTEDK